MYLKLLCLLLVSGLGWSPKSDASESVLKVVTSNEEFLGFRQDFENGIPTAGLEIDLIQEVCKVLEKTCVIDAIDPGFSVGPIPTIIHRVQDHTYDVAIAFMRGTKQRMYEAKASAPYLQTRVTVYGYQDSLAGAESNSTGAPTFENAKVRYVVVGAYEKTVRELLYPADEKAFEIIKVETDDEAIELLKSGGADATVTSELKTSYSKQMTHYKHFDSPSDEQWGPRMYTSNSKIKLMRDINAALKVLIDNGTYDLILKRYGIEGMEPCFQGEDDDATINIVADYEKCL